MHPRNRCAKIVLECEQFIRDVEWWNTNRTDAPPMDCEPMQVLLPVARACMKAWESGDMERVGVLAKQMKEIGRNTAKE